jgi:hypothetical protein
VQTPQRNVMILLWFYSEAGWLGFKTPSLSAGNLLL